MEKLRFVFGVFECLVSNKITSKLNLTNLSSERREDAKWMNERMNAWEIKSQTAIVNITVERQKVWQLFKCCFWMQNYPTLWGAQMTKKKEKIIEIALRRCQLRCEFPWGTMSGEIRNLYCDKLTLSLCHKLEHKLFATKRKTREVVIYFSKKRWRK